MALLGRGRVPDEVKDRLVALDYDQVEHFETKLRDLLGRNSKMRTPDQVRKHEKMVTDTTSQLYVDMAKATMGSDETGVRRTLANSYAKLAMLCGFLPDYCMQPIMYAALVTIACRTSAYSMVAGLEHVDTARANMTGNPYRSADVLLTSPLPMTHGGNRVDGYLTVDHDQMLTNQTASPIMTLAYADDDDHIQNDLWGLAKRTADWIGVELRSHKSIQGQVRIKDAEWDDGLVLAHLDRFKVLGTSIRDLTNVKIVTDLMKDTQT